MRCQHCHEELERWTTEDPAAHCPDCGLRLTETPVEFAELPSPSEQADDLLAINRLVASLEQQSPELFLFPTNLKNKRFVEQVPPTSSTSTNDNILLAVHNVLSSINTELDSEATVVPLLTWLMLGCGALATVGGFVLLVGSYLVGHANGWSLGVAFTLGGQITLHFGLLMCLDFFRRTLLLNRMRMAEQRARCQLARDLANTAIGVTRTSRAA